MSHNVKFSITTRVPGPRDYVGRYKVLSNGVLGVVTSDGDAFFLSPSAWFRVDVLDAPDFNLDTLLAEAERPETSFGM